MSINARHIELPEQRSAVMGALAVTVLGFALGLGVLIFGGSPVGAADAPLQASTTTTTMVPPAITVPVKAVAVVHPPARTAASVSPTTVTVPLPGTWQNQQTYQDCVQAFQNAGASTAPCTPLIPAPWVGARPADQRMSVNCPSSGVNIETHTSYDPNTGNSVIGWQDVWCGLAQPGYTWKAPTVAGTLPPVVYTNQTCWAPPALTYPGEPTQTGLDYSKEVCR